MKPNTIDLIRDLSVSYEKNDLETAFDLMKIAYRARPYEPFIERKFLQYQAALNNPALKEQQVKLKNLVESGELAIIPIGLRCHTAEIIKEKLGVQQATLPFDIGFFSPDAVASVFENPHINLVFDDQHTQVVCIKTEENMDSAYGLGVKFESSTYADINAIATSKNIDSINKYLDSTFGYYTLDKCHNFVLAHYNWHPLSDPSKSNGVTEPEQNLKKINEILNNRILRMLDMCTKAKHILFIFGDIQNYKYLQIDNKYYLLNDFDRLNKICSKKYHDKFSIISNINDVDTASVLKLLK